MNISTRLFSLLFPRYTWKRKTKEKIAYLTFDDGPIPEITEWVLDLLKEEDILATFFCIGDNIRKHPQIFKRILHENHQVGNHTFNHLKGWETPATDYLNNFEQCQEEIKKHTDCTPKLFRPPYGKIKREQANSILTKGVEIIMWSIVTEDYIPTSTPEQCLKNALHKVKPGAIIVFHDSIKASNNMKYALPRTIKALKEQGYSFKTL